jgi:hypothetical protein
VYGLLCHNRSFDVCGLTALLMFLCHVVVGVCVCVCVCVCSIILLHVVVSVFCPVS